MKYASVSSSGTMVGKVLTQEYNKGIRNNKLGEWVDYPGKIKVAPDKAEEGGDSSDNGE